MTLTPELTLGDRYRLVTQIALGGMGEVWRAEDELLGRPVAIKVLRQEYADDRGFLDRFRAEARHTASLSHPGIASVYDYGELGDTAYLVMELVDGEPLSVLLAHEGRLSPERTLDIVGQAGLALQAAHDADVVHRDVKPGNLLVRPDGVVKVTDFGIARGAESASTTSTGMIVGTAYYLSPEQGAGRDVTPASDVYSLGVVAYECLAGWRPFVGENPVSIAAAHVHEEPPPLPADVPVPVRDLVDAALAKSPADRPASAGEFGRAALALREWLLAGAAGSPPAGPAPVGSRVARSPARSRRLGRTLVAALVAVLLGTLALRACDHRRTTAAPRSGASPAAGHPVATVTVDPARYRGRPYPLVRTELVALGLAVVEAPAAAGAGTAAGTVVTVAPAGQVAAGATVSVTVAVAAASPTVGAGRGRSHRGHGKGRHR